MNNFFKFFLLICLLTFSSCGTKRLISKTNPVKNTDNIAYIEPLAYISIIEKGNVGVHNDSISKITKLILDSVIIEDRTFRQKTKTTFSSETDSLNTIVEINNLFNQILLTKNLERIKIGPNLSNHLKANGNKYYLATIASGFGRKKGNYGKQVGKAIGLGILTLGMYSQVPIKSTINLYAVIIDAEKLEVVYFSNTLPLEKSPTDRNVVKAQFKKLLFDHFHPQTSGGQ